MGIFLRGEFGPRRRPWPSKTWPPCFKYKTSPTMPSPEPLYGFKYSPWPSVSTLAMFEPFFKYSPFPIALFVAFCAKADPTPNSAPVANFGRTVFAKNGKAFAAKPARDPRNLPYFHIVNNLTFTHFYCDAFSILISYCHSVHLWIGQSKNITSTQIFIAKCSQDFMYQLCVSIFAVDFQKSLHAHWYKSFILCYKFLSSHIWLSGFLHEDSIVFRFGLLQLFPFHWFYLESLEDAQGFSGSQRFCNQAKRLERNCKLCFAFSSSHKTLRWHQRSQELNWLIRCWQHFAIRECPLHKPNFEIQECSKLNFALWNQPESRLEFQRHFSKCWCLLKSSQHHRYAHFASSQFLLFPQYQWDRNCLLKFKLRLILFVVLSRPQWNQENIWKRCFHQPNLENYNTSPNSPKPSYIFVCSPTRVAG